MEEDIEACCRTVTSMFPDICTDYVRRISSDHSGNSEMTINAIMDSLEQKIPYPRRPTASLKRKRESVSEEANPRMTELKRKYADVDLREKVQSSEDTAFIAQVLRKHFIYLSDDNISQAMNQHNNLLLPTYLDLEEKLRNWDTYEPKPWPGLTAAIASRSTNFLAELVKDTKTIRPTATDHEGAVKSPVFRELLSAIRIRNSRIQAIESEKVKKAEQEKRDEEAMASGFFAECGCCFADFSLHSMVHCDGHQEHAFCFKCARRNAEVQVGLSRWELKCMSTDGCSGGFSHGERTRFLDAKLIETLNRIEADSAVNLAGLNLTTCPFCPFAAEYPSIEEDREFHCKNENCLKISCRLCNKETHVPKTCDEACSDDQRSARLKIEEAMSSAMIRVCNKCKTPFIKEQGCNKMTCPKPNCRNMQCYICSQDCSYDHFQNRAAIPQASASQLCHLYDRPGDNRHEKEVEKARSESTKQVREERPDIDPEHLEIRMSENVKKDEERRGRTWSRRHGHRNHGMDHLLPWRFMPAHQAEDFNQQVLAGHAPIAPAAPAAPANPTVQPPAAPRPAAALPATLPATMPTVPEVPLNMAEALVDLPLQRRVNELMGALRHGPRDLVTRMGRLERQARLQTEAERNDGAARDAARLIERNRALEQMERLRTRADHARARAAVQVPAQDDQYLRTPRAQLLEQGEPYRRIARDMYAEMQVFEARMRAARYPLLPTGLQEDRGPISGMPPGVTQPGTRPNPAAPANPAGPARQ